MARLLVLQVLFFPAVLWCIGLARPSMGGESWETQPYAQTTTASNFVRSVVPSPPQQPVPVVRPVSWPAASAPAGFDALGEAYLSDSAAQTRQQAPASGYPYPQTGYPQTTYPQTAYPQTTVSPAASPALPSTPVSANPAPSVGSAWNPAAGGSAISAVPTYPSTMPGGAMSPSYGFTPPAAASSPAAGAADLPPGAREAQMDGGPGVVAELKPCEGAQPLATVGREWILAVEVLGMVNQTLDPYKEKMSASQFEEQRQLLTQQLLQKRIETKLIYLDATRTIPAENLPKVETQIGDYFEKDELPAMLKRAKLSTRQELDAKLLTFGTSVDRQKRSFIEQALAQQWAREQMKGTGEVTHEQMLAYYQEHSSEYEHQAQARWEQLMVRYSDFPNKQEAWKAMAEMGNQVLGGIPLGEVAKARSKGPTASIGGMRDWTQQGSLVSESLNQALFALPIGQLSQVLEDKQGLHIIRVVERKEAGRTPFLEAQTEIREKIKEDRKRKKLDDYLARLRKEIPVWTVFDDPKGNPLVSQAESTRR